jgi:muconolactone delta-isomerase
VAGEGGADPQKRQPVQIAHVDQTHAATIARVHRHLSEAEASQRVKRRFQIINLWRPIGHAAFDMPLALCDFRSVDVNNDLLPSRLIYADREGETFAVVANPNHKWKYVSGLRPDEYVLIKWWVLLSIDWSRELTHVSSVVNPRKTSRA